MHLENGLLHKPHFVGDTSCWCEESHGPSALAYSHTFLHSNFQKRLVCLCLQTPNTDSHRCVGILKHNLSSGDQEVDAQSSLVMSSWSLFRTARTKEQRLAFSGWWHCSHEAMTSGTDRGKQAMDVQRLLMPSIMISGNRHKWKRIIFI